MTLTRYEFGGVGIFHALDLLENCEMEKQDEEDYEWAERQFEKDLEIPDFKGMTQKTISYFTSKGLEAFETPLDILINLFYKYAEGAGLGEVKEIKKEIVEQENPYYQDDYQVVLIK